MFRSRSQVTASIVLMLLFGGLFIWVALKEADGAPLGYIGVPVLVAVCLRMALQRVKVTAKGVDVRNFFGSRFILW